MVISQGNLSIIKSMNRRKKNGNELKPVDNFNAKLNPCKINKFQSTVKLNTRKMDIHNFYCYFLIVISLDHESKYTQKFPCKT